MTDFLCGCSQESKKNYRMDLMPDGKALSARRLDDEGYEVCPEHGERLMGWRSELKRGVQGNLVRDYSRERARAARRPDLKMSWTPDRRDNRDPEVIGKAFLAERRGVKNGKSAVVMNQA